MPVRPERGEGVVAALRLGSGAGGAGTTLACPLLMCPEPSVGAGSEALRQEAASAAALWEKRSHAVPFSHFRASEFPAWGPR